ncbi:hypothetical protein FUAX_07340 [Fulvitalea axinellae]|uniref:Uncharacterized protein n=1 Tax=Fulvitalea axinellae TaxID=1182444 RepID=A0AAU9CSF6_9BACT|nr:hypothetical protein FUAX_07340 [Fulvitalea axinellae]
MEEQLKPENCIPPEDYPKIAENLGQCQTYIDEETKYIRQILYKALGKEAKEDTLDGKVANLLDIKQKLVRDIAGLEFTISQEQDANLLAKFEVDLAVYKARLLKINFDLENNKSDSIADVHHATTDAIVFGQKYRIYRQALLNYINDYVVPGNIGEGSVFFEGVEYVASLASQD